jgi:hypothetical protein
MGASIRFGDRGCGTCKDVEGRGCCDARNTSSICPLRASPASPATLRLLLLLLRQLTERALRGSSAATVGADREEQLHIPTRVGMPWTAMW